MEDLNEQISAVTNPAEAVDQFVGEQFIEWLVDYIRHWTQQSPAVKFLQSGELRPEKIRKVLIQRFIVLQSFWGTDGEPGFLRFATANLSESDDSEAESPLEILQTWLQSDKANRYLQTWGAVIKQAGGEEDLGRAKPKEFTRNYIAELSDIYSTQEWPIALGALAAEEWGLAFESQIWRSVVAQWPAGAKEAEALQHLGDSKSVIDIGHLLEKVVFDPETKKLIWQGVSRQLELKQEFFGKLTSLAE